MSDSPHAFGSGIASLVERQANDPRAIRIGPPFALTAGQHEAAPLHLWVLEDLLCPALGPAKSAAPKAMVRVHPLESGLRQLSSRACPAVP